MAVNYNPNVALIQGAAAIGRSTMPADLSGLDKVIEGGRTMLENARKERQKIDDMLNAAADKVLAKAGGLGEEMFSYATDQVEKYKQEYLQGVSTRGAEGDKMKRAAMNKMIQLSNFAQEHKELNNISAENYKNGMFSTALTNDQKTILTSIFDENYTLSENSNNEMVYNINVNGENKQITYDEYRELTSYLKDETLGNTYRTTRQSFLKEKDFQYDEFNHTIKQAIPNSELKFKLALHDNIQGQTFINMLMEDQSLTDDVLQSIANADPNDNITLDNYNKAETKAAIIDAITNPDNDAFDLQRSRTIMAEKLTIAAQKKHNKYYNELAEQRQQELNSLKSDDKTDYSQYIYVPDIKEGDTGEEVQISGDQRRKMQRKIDSKARNFQGTNGYYVRLSGTKDGKQMYFRFDTYKQYQKALEQYGGKIPSKKENFDKLFPDAKGGYGYNRYIDEDRLTELEVGGKINLPLD